MLRRTRQLATNLALALVATIGTVAVLEGGARVLQLPAVIFIYPAPNNCMQRDAQLSLTWAEKCSGTMWGSSFRINSEGLRGAEVRNDGAARILAIGDSCTWGWGASDAGTYPAVLQDLLDQRFGTGRYQVLNAAMPGYTSYQGLVYLRERGLQLKPSIVIAGYGFNDATLDGDILKRIAGGKRSMPFLRLDDFLLYRSYFWRWARSRWHVEHGKELVPRVDVPHFSENLTQILDLVHQNKARALLLDFLGPLGTSASYSNAMHEVASNQDVPVLFYQGPRADLVHPTPDGYRILAEQVFDRLVAAGYVPGTLRSRS